MKILVIDDNVALGETLAMMLETMGHAPAVALTGQSGVEAARSNPPRLILLDLGLPDIDGYETCRRLRQLPDLDDAVIVAQTGHGEPEEMDKAASAGFDRFIVKPAPFETLEDLIASVEAGD
jgi:CheY-like chemotaxis protein